MKISTEVFRGWFEATSSGSDTIDEQLVYEYMKKANPEILQYFAKCKDVSPLFAAGFFAAMSLVMRQEEINELEN